MILSIKLIYFEILTHFLYLEMPLYIGYKLSIKFVEKCRAQPICAICRSIPTYILYRLINVNILPIPTTNLYIGYEISNKLITHHSSPVIMTYEYSEIYASYLQAIERLSNFYLSF